MIFGRGGGGPWSSLSETKNDPYPAQLYNLAADVGETTNLYAEHPKVVKNMTALMTTARRQRTQYPRPRPDK